MLEQLVAAALACVAIDGDTIKCGNETVRLQNIDAAEIHGRCAFETDLAQRAKSFTARRLTEGDVEIVDPMGWSALTTIEPPRDCRRLFGLSDAASFCSPSMA